MSNKGNSREWNRINQRLEALPKAAPIYEGFCPILPKRMRFATRLGEIITATRKRGAKPFKAIPGVMDMSIEDLVKETEKDADLLFIPRRDDYYANVQEQRDFFFSFVGGNIQPMEGAVALDIEVIYPSDEDYEKRGVPKRFRSKFDVDNCFKSIQDALDFRTRTVDGKKVGIVVDDTAICEIHGTKHARREGERAGYRFTIRQIDPDESTQSTLNDTLVKTHVDDRQRHFAWHDAQTHTDPWENRLKSGLPADARAKLRISLLATDATELDPQIARYYLGLRAEFDRSIAAKLALDKQSEIAYRIAMAEDAEALLCEVEEDADELAEKHDLDLSGITEPISIIDLNRI